MVTWHPVTRVTPNNEIVNDECECVVRLLPLRCIIDQKAVRFIRAFLRSENVEDSDSSALPPGFYAFPPPLFTSFKFKPYRLKVDYRPEKIDTQALRNGSVVELINLSPIDGMVLTLKEVHAVDEIGFGSVMTFAVMSWIQDICATQIHKFVTSSRPIEPLSNLGRSASDLIVLPWEAIRNGESIQRALRAGAGSFTNAVMYEGFTLTSNVAHFLADKVHRVTSFNTIEPLPQILPSRPLAVPRDLADTAPHALESLSRGLQAANYKVVIVPYREYHRSGARGAVTSVIKGIPVAIAAPASGAAEALSFALLGARNQFRPDIRKEEEANQRGLHLSD